MSLVDQILGEGAGVIWRIYVYGKTRKKSGITLVIATLFWYVLEIMETRFLPFLCSILLLLMLLLFLWANFGQLLIIRIPPTPEQMNLEGSPVRALFSKIESLVLILYEIAYGKDIKTFLWTILYVAIIDTVGSYINLLTILYICVLCSMTIPVLYLDFQEGIDSFIGKEKDKLLEVFKSNVLDKIPRAPKVE